MATWSGTIGASSDDALQDAGTVTLTGATPTINASNKYAGFRFTNVTVDQGSTTSAPTTLDLYLPSAANDDADVDIWAEATDDAATFSATSNNISGRTATTAVVTWTASSLGTGWKSSPDIASIIQEIVSRPGWVSGNDIVIVLKGRSVNALRFEAYDGGAGTYATLNITYTTGGGVTKQAMHYARMRA